MLQQYAKSLLNLVYPNNCAACGRRLVVQENLICLHCLTSLPQSNQHLVSDNALAQRFWGQVKIGQAAAFYRFTKNSRIQRLIHQLKYQSRTEVGVLLGELYGQQLKKDKAFTEIDLIIPIPLHPVKQKRRGFNQSDYFAEGLANVLGVPWYSDAVIRTVYTETQTRKTSTERWKNVEAIFSVKRPELLMHKHTLLVDDLITTGATITSCAQTILDVEQTKVSLSAIAFTSDF
ncbi:MAG: ComF family protein [Chitinophagales bacterium]